MNAPARQWSRDFNSMQDEMERMFRQVFGGDTSGATTAGAWSPALDVEKVEARYANGLLTITVPKAEEAKPRRIAVQKS